MFSTCCVMLRQTCVVRRSGARCMRHASCPGEVLWEGGGAMYDAGQTQSV